MNMIEAIKQTVVENATLFGFEYDGKQGNIDPCWTPDSGNSFLLFFDKNEQTVYNIEDVLHTPFVNGKTLYEIRNQIELTDW